MFNKSIERNIFARGKKWFNCKSKVQEEVKVWYPLHKGGVGV